MTILRESKRFSKLSVVIYGRPFLLNCLVKIILRQFYLSVSTRQSQKKNFFSQKIVHSCSGALLQSHDRWFQKMFVKINDFSCVVKSTCFVLPTSYSLQEQFRRSPFRTEWLSELFLGLRQLWPDWTEVTNNRTCLSVFCDT